MAPAAVNEIIFCLDTGVWNAFLAPEEPKSLQDAVSHLVLRALRDGRIVAPAFA